jgi:hypothetical protein
LANTYRSVRCLSSAWPLVVGDLPKSNHGRRVLQQAPFFAFEQFSISKTITDLHSKLFDPRLHLGNIHIGQLLIRRFRQAKNRLEDSNRVPFFASLSTSLTAGLTAGLTDCYSLFDQLVCYRTRLR